MAMRCTHHIRGWIPFLYLLKLKPNRLRLRLKPAKYLNLNRLAVHHIFPARRAVAKLVRSLWLASANVHNLTVNQVSVHAISLCVYCAHSYHLAFS